MLFELVGFSVHTKILTSIMNMYAKCENIESARRIFHEILRKDVVTWNAMLSGY